jgi:hypothetical protein
VGSSDSWEFWNDEAVLLLPMVLVLKLMLVVVAVLLMAVSSKKLVNIPCCTILLFPRVARKEKSTRTMTATSLEVMGGIWWRMIVKHNRSIVHRLLLNYLLSLS